MSGRSRQHIEEAVVVDVWLRQAQWAAPTLTGFGGHVEQVLGIEFAQPVQGERWPGEAARLPLSSWRWHYLFSL